MSTKIKLNIAILTISDSRTLANDKSGDILNKLIKESQDLTKIPIGLEAYKAYKNERKEISDASKVKDVAIDDMNVQLNKLDLYLAKSDTILQTRLKKFKEETAEDHYIRESLRVLAEMVKM